MEDSESSLQITMRNWQKTHILNRMVSMQSMHMQILTVTEYMSF